MNQFDVWINRLDQLSQTLHGSQKLIEGSKVEFNGKSAIVWWIDPTGKWVMLQFDDENNATVDQKIARRKALNVTPFSDLLAYVQAILPECVNLDQCSAEELIDTILDYEFGIQLEDDQTSRN